jgi:2-oxoglutarate dehydrogenase E2 component (dihydrolipoamide succinyltransferase)
MPITVKMPQLGESVVEGTVARWLKAPGDFITKLEPLLEISTDKIDTEVPAPADGLLLEIVVAEGQTVRAGAPLAYIGASGEEVGNAEHGVRNTQYAIRNVAAAPPEVERPSGRDFISPVVSRMVTQHKLDLAQINGSGAQGRVTKKDVLAYLEQRQSPQPTTTIKSPAPRPTDDNAHSAFPTPHAALAPDEFLQPLTTMRRAIAQHMVQSVQTSPHVTTIFEVDMLAVVRHREAYKQAYAAKGLNLTFTPYFIAAAAAGLKKVPEVNSRFTAAGLVFNRRIHIGVAVALSEGLIVPVIGDADEKNLQGLTRAVNDLADQARRGKLAPDAVKGGTFTLTNHGVSGSLLGTPIINQPQSGILGIGAIVKRPVVRSSNPSLLPGADDAIVIRPMCYLNFTFDHRVLDGARADAFLTVVKEKLENWESAE